MAGVICEFGFRIPVVARSTGEVVDGHLRLKAAQALGLDREARPGSVVAVAKRRQFSSSDKHRILDAANRCTQPSDIVGLLRKEGIYSHLGC